ncbi:MAG TPA: transposase, partial [Jatrophihabitans sp.]|nr:transposase [Jatrophihabitans sp.]
MDYYTHPPPDTTVIAADELGPVTPRTFDPPPGWSPDGHRVKAPLTYSRGPEKTWIYGGVRISDGQAVTCCAPSRNSAHWQAFLARLEQVNPTGTLAVITDNLSSHSSVATRAWLAGHPRLEQVFIPKGACWLNLQEAWWRIFRRHALAGQTFADPTEIAQVTEL